MVALEDPLHVHYGIPRVRPVRNFDWEELFDLADFRADVFIAESTGVTAAKSTLVRIYQDKFQVLVWFSVDRTFVTSGAEAS